MRKKMMQAARAAARSIQSLLDVNLPMTASLGLRTR
jgi:hypothetical protein